jgi:hypothetical protein
LDRRRRQSVSHQSNGGISTRCGVARRRAGKSLGNRRAAATRAVGGLACAGMPFVERYSFVNR